MCPLSPHAGHIRLIHDLRTQDIIRTPAVIEAMTALDRGLFVPLYLRHRAYDDRPVPIGGVATLSAPHMHGICLELLVKTLQTAAPPHRILDVGSGSGYLTLALYLLSKNLSQQEPQVVGIDCDLDLVQTSLHTARRILPDALQNQKISLVCGDGWLGYASLAPFDAIHVGAAAPRVPEALKKQLRIPGGRLIIPIGHEGCTQVLTVIDAQGEDLFKSTSNILVQYVPLRQFEDQKTSKN